MSKFINVKWMGHSNWELTTSTGTKIVIDPWYTDNPKNPGDAEDVKADYVLITHDHWDHVKDVPVLVRNGAKVVTQPEVEKRLVTDENLNPESFIRINTGGTIPLEDDLKVTLIQAFHSSDSGTPSGLIIEHGDVTIMNVGDTALYGDMQLYGELYEPTLLMLPIGDRFTMGPREAAKAVSLVKPKQCIPMHYNTFGAIEQDPQSFADRVQNASPETETIILEPGQGTAIYGKKVSV